MRPSEDEERAKLTRVASGDSLPTLDCSADDTLGGSSAADNSSSAAEAATGLEGSATETELHAAPVSKVAPEEAFLCGSGVFRDARLEENAFPDQESPGGAGVNREGSTALPDSDARRERTDHDEQIILHTPDVPPEAAREEQLEESAPPTLRIDFDAASPATAQGGADEDHMLNFVVTKSNKKDQTSATFNPPPRLLTRLFERNSRRRDSVSSDAVGDAEERGPGLRGSTPCSGGGPSVQKLVKSKKPLTRPVGPNLTGGREGRRSGSKTSEDGGGDASKGGATDEETLSTTKTRPVNREEAKMACQRKSRAGPGGPVSQADFRKELSRITKQLAELEIAELEIETEVRVQKLRSGSVSEATSRSRADSKDGASDHVSVASEKAAPSIPKESAVGEMGDAGAGALASSKVGAPKRKLIAPNSSPHDQQRAGGTRGTSPASSSGRTEIRRPGQNARRQVPPAPKRLSVRARGGSAVVPTAAGITDYTEPDTTIAPIRAKVAAPTRLTGPQVRKSQLRGLLPDRSPAEGSTPSANSPSKRGETPKRSSVVGASNVVRPGGPGRTTPTARRSPPPRFVTRPQSPPRFAHSATTGRAPPKAGFGPPAHQQLTAAAARRRLHGASRGAGGEHTFDSNSSYNKGGTSVIGVSPLGDSSDSLSLTQSSGVPVRESRLRPPSRLSGTSPKFFLDTAAREQAGSTNSAVGVRKLFESRMANMMAGYESELKDLRGRVRKMEEEKATAGTQKAGAPKLEARGSGGGGSSSSVNGGDAEDTIADISAMP